MQAPGFFTGGFFYLEYCVFYIGFYTSLLVKQNICFFLQ
jgi:hypothetical protein